MKRRSLIACRLGSTPDRWPTLDEIRELLAAHGTELPRAERVPYFGLPYEPPPQPYENLAAAQRAAHDAAMGRLRSRLVRELGR